MAHYLFNLAADDGHEATLLATAGAWLRAARWRVEDTERHRNALTVGDLALVYLSPLEPLIAPVRVCTPVLLLVVAHSGPVSSDCSARAGRMVTMHLPASCVDGFIADTDDSLSWSLSRHVDVTGPVGCRSSVCTQAGALVLGSTTYEWMLADDDSARGRWRYNVPTWVFSRRLLRSWTGTPR